MYVKFMVSMIEKKKKKKLFRAKYVTNNAKIYTKGWKLLRYYFLSFIAQSYTKALTLILWHGSDEDIKIG